MILPLLLLSLVMICYGEVTMIKVFGKVSYDDPTNGAVFELQDCIDECFYTLDCILSYMDSNNHCLMYNYSTILILNVTETTRADGYYVAFKVDLKPDTCPADYRAIEYCGSIGSFKFCWDTTSIDWVITNLCPEPWKKFVRDNGVTVCLQGFKGFSVTKSTTQRRTRGESPPVLRCMSDVSYPTEN